MEGIDLKKEIVHFTRKPAKMGKYYVFSIPASYIKNGLVDVNETYTIYLEKVPQETGKKKEDE